MLLLASRKTPCTRNIRKTLIPNTRGQNPRTLAQFFIVFAQNVNTSQLISTFSSQNGSFHEYVSRCLQLPPDASRCLQMPPDVSGCLQISPNASRCLLMCPDACRCLQMLPDASRCLQMPPDASRCFHMPPDVSTCLWMTTDASRCLQMLPSLPPPIPPKRKKGRHIYKVSNSRSIAQRPLCYILWMASGIMFGSTR